MPNYVKGAKIALLNAALEIKKPEFDTNIRIDDPSMIQKFLTQEEYENKGYSPVVNQNNPRPNGCYL